MENTQGYQLLVQTLNNLYPHTDRPITADATLDSLGLDSLAVVELFVHLNDQFQIQLDEGMADPLLTVEQMSHIVEQALNDATQRP